jgi:LmbE family N-acetylglucosaminyl deacetylase
LRFFVFLIFSLVSSPVWALTMGPIPDITSSDRILILAPHPDDETIGTGGVIQKAVAVGAKVKVVLLTNGENNELSFIVYKKRPVLLKKDLIAMGQVRRGESIAAMSSLGLNENDVVSLGYPDFGTMDVMTRFWGPDKPFRSMLSRVRYVPYDNALSPGAPYIGDSVLRDLKFMILSFRPTKIFVSHPADVNRDHRALYLFTQVALWDIDGKMKQPYIYPYIVHVVGWPKPRGFHPDLVLGVPKGLENSVIAWDYLKLEPEEIEKKQEAVLRYVSQNKYAPNYLIAFDRQNELFGDYPETVIYRQMASEVKWQYISTGDEALPRGKDRLPDKITGLAYARQGSDLLIRLDLRQEISREIGLTIYLLGYSPKTPFSEMPKISLDLNLSGLTVKDKKKRLPSKDVIFTSAGKVVTFKIPLSLLGDPDRILSSAKTSVFNLTLDETAWRILELK